MGLSSWETTVTLPPESFVVELYKISDGAVGDLVFHGQPEWSKEPEKGLRIVAGKEEGKYRFAIIYDSGSTIGTSTDVEVFDYTSTSSLPKTVTAGDYFLFGKPKEKGTNGEPLIRGEIRSCSAGFLLRIAKLP